MKKSIVKLEWWDPTAVIGQTGQEGECIFYTAYGELELYRKKFYFLYTVYPTPPLVEGKAVSFVIPKGCVKSITKLEEVNATNANANTK